MSTNADKMGDAFDRIVESLDPALVIVTAASGGRHGGCLVGFHGQSSIDPIRYTLWISKANYTSELVSEAKWVGVHFLAQTDLDLARLFGGSTGDDVDKLARCVTEKNQFQVPLLVRCRNRIVGRTVALLEVDGDHLCLIVEPIEISCEDRFIPLRLADITPLEPGHKAQERR